MPRLRLDIVLDAEAFEYEATDAWLALDVDAQAQLMERGLPCLPFPEARRAEALADGAMTRWQQVIASLAGTHATSPLRMVAYRHARWIARCAWLQLATEEAFRSARPDEVVVHVPAQAVDRPHLLDLERSERWMPGLAFFVGKVAQQYGATVRLRPVGSAPRSDGVAAASKSASLECAASRQRVIPPGHLLMVADGSERASQRAIASELPASMSIIHLSHHASMWSADGRDAESERLYPDAYVGPIPSADSSLADSRASVNAFLSVCASFGDEGANLLTHEGLRPHIEWLFGPYAARVEANMACWRAAFERHSPFAVVAAYPSIAVEVAALTGIPTLVLPHGPMMTGADLYHRLLPERTVIGAVGSVHARLLRAQGIDAERILVTGCGSSPACAAMPRNRGIAPRMLIVIGRPVRPAQIGMLPITSPHEELRELGAVAAAARTHGWRVEVRRHPRFAPASATLQRAAGPEAVVTDASQIPLDRALVGCDALIAIGAPSSVIAEAAGAGIPVWIMESALPQSDAIERWGLSDFPRAPDAEALMREIARLDQSPGGWEERRTQVRRAADAFLASGPEPAVRWIEAQWSNAMHRETLSRSGQSRSTPGSPSIGRR